MSTVLVCAFVSAPALADLTITVPGTACPYFAGQTFGSIPLSADNYFNVDTTVSSIIPPSIDVTGFGGTIPSITAAGAWQHFVENPPTGGPGGYTDYDLTHQAYIDLGISTVLNVHLDTLLGVFLTNAAPVPLTAPQPLALGDDMTQPLLQQTFVIGTGLQNIVIPTGATRLFFGLHNGYEWSNNVGAVEVTVVPAPAALLLGLLGLTAAGWKLRKFA
jgi:hypothetical protein